MYKLFTVLKKVALQFSIVIFAEMKLFFLSLNLIVLDNTRTHNLFSQIFIVHDLPLQGLSF